jgi:hypothetical protein
MIARLILAALLVVGCGGAGPSPSPTAFPFRVIDWCSENPFDVAAAGDYLHLYPPVNGPKITVIGVDGRTGTAELGSMLSVLATAANRTDPRQVLVATQVAAEWIEVDREGFFKACTEAYPGGA